MLARMSAPAPVPAPRLVRYGDAPSQRGELLLPGNARPPVACLLHGGFWRVAYGNEQMTAVARDLVARGFAVWNVEYRRLGEAGGGWPGTFLDVAAALDHLAAIAAELPLDLARVALVGHSAGGHLALWAASRGTRPDGPAPAPRVNAAAVVGQAAVSDLARGHALGLSRGVVGELLGGAPGERPERYAAASPLARLPLGVPQLLVHGTEDDTVPVGLSRAYARAAREAGDPCELAEIAGMGHMEFLDPACEAHAVTVAWLGARLAPGA